MRRITKVVLMATLFAGTTTISGVQAEPAEADPASCGYSEDNGYAYWGNCSYSANDYIQVDWALTWDQYHCVRAQSIKRLGDADYIRGAHIVYFGCNP